MLQPGDQAPAFRVHQIKDGKPFQLEAELENGPVLLIFAKESCPTCRFGVPLMDRLASHSAGASGRVLLLLQEMPFMARKFVDSLGLKSPAAVDEHPYPISQAYGIAFVPSAFYIRPGGIIEQAAESFDRDELAHMFEALARANGRPPKAFSDLDPDIPSFRPG